MPKEDGGMMLADRDGDEDTTRIGTEMRVGDDGDRRQRDGDADQWRREYERDRDEDAAEIRFLGAQLEQSRTCSCWLDLPPALLDRPACRRGDTPADLVAGRLAAALLALQRLADTADHSTLAEDAERLLSLPPDRLLARIATLAAVADLLPKETFPETRPEALAPLDADVVAVPWDLGTLVDEVLHGLPAEAVSLVRLGVEGLTRT